MTCDPLDFLRRIYGSAAFRASVGGGTEIITTDGAAQLGHPALARPPSSQGHYEGCHGERAAEEGWEPVGECHDTLVARQVGSILPPVFVSKPVCGSRSQVNSDVDRRPLERPEGAVPSGICRLVADWLELAPGDAQQPPDRQDPEITWPPVAPQFVAAGVAPHPHHDRCDAQQ